MTNQNLELPLFGGTKPKVVYSQKMLTNIVNEQDDQPDRGRGGEEYLHASSLLNFCGRRDKLTKDASEPIASYPRSADRVVWAIGRACEAHIRKQIQKGIGRENIFASWRCVCQETRVEGLWEMKICEHCKKPCNTFHEIPVWDHDLKIVGNPDILLMDNGKLRVVEIKSINKKEFDLLESAKPDHITQANIYQRMLVNEGFPVHHTSIVFYCSKDYGWQNPYKEYHVTSEQSAILLDGIFASVRSYRYPEWTGEKLPARLTNCTHSASAMAKKCPQASRCFSYL